MITLPGRRGLSLSHLLVRRPLVYIAWAVLILAVLGAIASREARSCQDRGGQMVVTGPVRVTCQIPGDRNTP